MKHGGHGSYAGSPINPLLEDADDGTNFTPGSILSNQTNAKSSEKNVRLCRQPQDSFSKVSAAMTRHSYAPWPEKRIPRLSTARPSSRVPIWKCLSAKKVDKEARTLYLICFKLGRVQ